jgi:hypothetical protein
MKNFPEKITGAFLLVLFLLHSADAFAGIYLTFAGNNASGNVDGVGFSNSAWRLEFGIDENAADSELSPDLGIFVDSILEGRIEIGGTLYELAGMSSQGLTALFDFPLPTGRHQVTVGPQSGGFVQFLTGSGGIFPALFANHEDMSSAVIGATVTDSTTDAFNNQSIISFQGEQALHALGGELISIFENSGPASGNFSLSVSETSAFAAPEPAVVPEASSLIAWWILASALAATCYLRRRRATIIQCQ